MTVTKPQVDHFWKSVVQHHFPDAELRFKDKSWFMRILGILLFFNPSFMTKFTTVIGNTVYVPTGKWVEDNPMRALFVLTHEFVHMWDRNLSKLLYRYDFYSLGYLALQIAGLLSLFSFLGFVSLWFLLFLVALVFLAPWPSPWRTSIEANGYAMTMYIRFLTIDPQYNKEEGAEYLAKKHFASKQYYWMSWDAAKVKNMLIERYETLPQTHGAFTEVSQWVKTQLT
jgi:hypothetical protein